MVFLFDTSSFSVRGLPVGMSLAGEGPGATACSGHSILTCRVNVMADGCELDTGLVSSYKPLKQSVDGDPVIELGWGEGCGSCSPGHRASLKLEWNGAGRRASWRNDTMQVQTREQMGTACT